MVLTGESSACPPLDGDCAPEDLRLDDQGCCQICTPRNTSCSLTTLENTVGFVVFFDGDHGNCVNKENVAGWGECGGTCASGSKYNKRFASYDSHCTCCQTTTSRTLSVDTTCDDGATVTRTISVPSGCSCEACAEEQSPQPEQAQETPKQLNGAPKENEPVNSNSSLKDEEPKGQTQLAGGAGEDQSKLVGDGPNEVQGYNQNQDVDQSQGYVQDINVL